MVLRSLRCFGGVYDRSGCSTGRRREASSRQRGYGSNRYSKDSGAPGSSRYAEENGGADDGNAPGVDAGSSDERRQRHGDDALDRRPDKA